MMVGSQRLARSRTTIAHSAAMIPACVAHAMNADHQIITLIYAPAVEILTTGILRSHTSHDSTHLHDVTTSNAYCKQSNNLP